MGVDLIKVDGSDSSDAAVSAELARTERSNLPVNLIYPPNYPEEPAIMLNELVTPADVNLVLDRMQEIIDSMPKVTTTPVP